MSLNVSHIYWGDLIDQKNVSNLLELELQVIIEISLLMWVLGTKLRSSRRVANAYHCLAISAAAAPPFWRPSFRLLLIDLKQQASLVLASDL